MIEDLMKLKLEKLMSSLFIRTLSKHLAMQRFNKFKKGTLRLRNKYSIYKIDFADIQIFRRWFFFIGKLIYILYIYKEVI